TPPAPPPSRISLVDSPAPPAQRDGRAGGTAIGPEPMPYRVIQWSTGNVGTYALRHVIDHPELELVGLWVHSPSKVGPDARTFCSGPATGVRATNDVDALLAWTADCVCYTATADLRPFEAIEDICRILAAGKNVVSSSVVPLVHPHSFFPEVRDRLADACAKG